MKNDDLKELFDGLNFDITEPKEGHTARFLEKLENSQGGSSRRSRVRKLWTPIIAIAAGIALAFMLFGNFFNYPANQKGELASVSAEMKETQNFYTSLIERELKAIDDEKSPVTEAIINDALVQMEKLENEYEKLKQDLVNSGKDNRVIFAMISNFQKRIDLLNEVLIQIENKKSLKSHHHESTII